jgi:UDP-glucose 4-epimerase
VKLFVTGGAGYVGSVVVEQLVRDGHEVVVYDDLSTGHRAAVVPGARLVVGDLRDAAALAVALADGTDAVLHFAAQSIVAESMRDPLGTWEANLTGALQLLGAVAARRVPRLVLSSSAAVDGEPEAQPIPETEPARPTHAYGSSKRAIEMLLEDASSALGLHAVFLRYFNAAGASERCGEDHDPETHLVPRLLRRALEPGPPVPLYGDDYPTPDGTCVRDYVHVEDLAEAHVRALAGLDAGVHGPVNLGSGRGFSVRDILGCVESVTGSRVPVRVEPRRPGDPPRLVADIRRAAQELGWRPRRDLAAVVGSAWRWMQLHPRGYGEDAGRGANPGVG